MARFRQAVTAATGVVLAYVVVASVGAPGVPVWAGGLMLVLLLVRQVVALRENAALTRQLEARMAARTAELQASEALFRSVVQNISDVVTLVGPDRRVRMVSPAVQATLGYAPDDLVGTSLRDLTHPSDLDRALAQVGAISKVPGASASIAARVRRADGGWCHAEVTVTNVLDDPAVNGLVLSMRDVGERRQLEQRLRRLAFSDSLTGLANRARLYERVERSLARAGSRPAVLVLDLDGFKAVNDSLGHAMGDRILVEVGERLRCCVREIDTVARLGGDEFAVLLDGEDGAAHAPVVADRILRALSEPFEARSRSVVCLASIGVAVGLPGDAAADLLRDADVAMYEAKDRGKGRYELFRPELHEALVEGVALEADLRGAVDRGELLLHYQPIVDLGGERIIGVEALLRWLRPGAGLLTPAEFIPLAEATGLIVPIGRWVLDEACAQVRAWQQAGAGDPPLTVAVNVSARQLAAPDLVAAVDGALRRSGLDAACLTLEITEGVLAGASAEVASTVTALKHLGVRLSIDDFGTGYSSLGRLRSLPVDELKIDRSFVEEIEGGGDSPIVEAVLAMARSLDLEVVAEGIEHASQLDAVRRHGCRRAQGHLFARALPAAEAGRLIAGAAIPANKALKFPV